MKRFSMLLAGAATLLGCENAMSPNPENPSAREATKFASVSEESTPDGSVLRFFRLRSEGEAVPLGWCDEAAGVARVAVPGVGTMTHVGRLDLQQSSCIDPATGSVTDGTGVLTAANGDEIYLEYSGSATSVAPPTYQLHYSATGGTGRFTHAVGESEFVVVYTSETTWIAEGGGWISYAASDRAER
jgi:hypothetical protein